MLTPPGVVQSSARRSIHLSLMIGVEPFTVHGSICFEFFIPVPKRLGEPAACDTWCMASTRCQRRRQDVLNRGRNSRGFQPKSWIAGVASKIMPFAMRLPMATLAFATNGLANANAALHNDGGTAKTRR